MLWQGAAFAFSYDDLILLVQAEQKQYGAAKTNLSLDERLRSLEVAVFGQARSGSESKRLKDVCRKIGLISAEPEKQPGPSPRTGTRPERNLPTTTGAASVTSTEPALVSAAATPQVSASKSSSAPASNAASVTAPKIDSGPKAAWTASKAGTAGSAATGNARETRKPIKRPDSLESTERGQPRKPIKGDPLRVNTRPKFEMPTTITRPGAPLAEPEGKDQPVAAQPIADADSDIQLPGESQSPSSGNTWIVFLLGLLLLATLSVGVVAAVFIWRERGKILEEKESFEANACQDEPEPQASSVKETVSHEITWADSDVQPAGASGSLAALPPVFADGEGSHPAAEGTLVSVKNRVFKISVDGEQRKLQPLAAGEEALADEAPPVVTPPVLPPPASAPLAIGENSDAIDQSGAAGDGGTFYPQSSAWSSDANFAPPAGSWVAAVSAVTGQSWSEPVENPSAEDSSIDCVPQEQDVPEQSCASKPELALSVSFGSESGPPIAEEDVVKLAAFAGAQAKLSQPVSDKGQADATKPNKKKIREDAPTLSPLPDSVAAVFGDNKDDDWVAAAGFTKSDDSISNEQEPALPYEVAQLLSHISAGARQAFSPVYDAPPSDSVDTANDAAETGNPTESENGDTPELAAQGAETCQDGESTSAAGDAHCVEPGLQSESLPDSSQTLASTQTSAGESEERSLADPKAASEKLLSALQKLGQLAPGERSGEEAPDDEAHVQDETALADDVAPGALDLDGLEGGDRAPVVECSPGTDSTFVDAQAYPDAAADRTLNIGADDSAASDQYGLHNAAYPFEDSGKVQDATTVNIGADSSAVGDEYGLHNVACPFEDSGRGQNATTVNIGADDAGVDDEYGLHNAAHPFEDSGKVQDATTAGEVELGNRTPASDCSASGENIALDSPEDLTAGRAGPEFSASEDCSPIASLEPVQDFQTAESFRLVERRGVDDAQSLPLQTTGVEEAGALAGQAFAGGQVCSSIETLVGQDPNSAPAEGTDGFDAPGEQGEAALADEDVEQEFFVDYSANVTGNAAVQPGDAEADPSIGALPRSFSQILAGILDKPPVFSLENDNQTHPAEQPKSLVVEAESAEPADVHMRFMPADPGDPDQPDKVVVRTELTSDPTSLDEALTAEYARRDAGDSVFERLLRTLFADDEFQPELFPNLATGKPSAVEPPQSVPIPPSNSQPKITGSRVVASAGVAYRSDAVPGIPSPAGRLTGAAPDLDDRLESGQYQHELRHLFSLGAPTEAKLDRREHQAVIYETQPACLILLVDQSASMNAPLNTSSSACKSDVVAVVINRFIHRLIKRCKTDDGKIRASWYVGIVGYGEGVGPAFIGKHQGKDLVNVADLSMTVDYVLPDRPKSTIVGIPVWVRPKAAGPARMCGGLTAALKLARDFIAANPSSRPPIIVNISGGAVADGDPRPVAKALRGIDSADGRVLFFNVCLPGKKFEQAVNFPHRQEQLPNLLAAQALYDMSSPLLDKMIDLASEYQITISSGAKGFIWNNDVTAIAGLLEMCTAET